MARRATGTPTPPPGLTFDDTVVALARTGSFSEPPHQVETPMLEALRAAGTSHVYADTASEKELHDLVWLEGGGVLAEIDGNTANQPLVRKVFEDVLDAGDPAGWAKILREQRPDLSDAQLWPFLYAVVCGRIGGGLVRAFAGHRRWEVSLQLHMALCHDRKAATHVGRLLRGMVPTAIVKVPFAPHAPECFLVARDLERERIPVNFTSTFSARQVVAAALLGDVTRTNVFMGRLNQGLEAELLGEHVDLEAQRALRRLRREHGAKTRLIVASVHEWQTFARTAGCDVYTAPCEVLRAFLQQTEVEPGELKSRLETSYEDRLGISASVRDRLGDAAIARLWRVEPEFVEFLLDYRRSAEFGDLRDGEGLARRFEEAGFGDFFHTPDADEWKEIRRSKIPDLRAPLSGRLALDTLYSLLADADFEKTQEEMDRELARRVGS